ncbi:hypothetical protein EYF80_017155 [Liparis tanakae]|uniref:Uncharacterized protein n=1 Tax=Liparis tanakae TaxID=230148 RepID=A0A4Z2I3N2_9TELE|nr:hypothetical protein EYF80_017155 [Liparis tanakae]
MSSAGHEETLWTFPMKRNNPESLGQGHVVIDDIFTRSTYPFYNHEGPILLPYQGWTFDDTPPAQALLAPAIRQTLQEPEV